MMQLFKKYCFVFILLAVGFTAKAQVKPIRLKVTVDSIFRYEDSVYAVVYAGQNVGIGTGMSGGFYTAKGDEPWEYSEVAAGRVEVADTLYAIVKIIPNRGETYQVRDGDQFMLMVTPPARRYPNLYYDLALENIFFTDHINRRSFYSLSDLAARDEPGVEQEVTAEIIRSLRGFYEQVKSIDGPDKVYNRTAAGGRYKGESIKQLLAHLAPADVKSFVQYVSVYTKKYIGQDHLFLETFGGWFYSDAPYSTIEVKQALFPVFRNKALLKQTITPYALAIRSENMGLLFSSEASDLFDAGSISESSELMDFASALVEMINDDRGRAAVYLMKAQVLQDGNKLTEAIAECDKAIAIGQKYKTDTADGFADLKLTQIKALIKKGYIQYMVSAYKDARQTLDQAAVVVSKNRKTIGDGEYLAQMARRYSYAGYFDYIAKDYQSALANYNEAIRLNDSISTEASLISNADMLVQLGKIFVSQKKTPEAIAAFNNAGAIYSNYKRGKENTILTELGLAYYEADQFDNSLAYFKQVYARYVSLADRSNAGYIQSLIGNAYAAKGQADSSIAAHSLALTLRRDNSYGVAYTFNQLSGLYRSTGLKTQALQAIDSALVYYRLAKDSSGVSEVLTLAGKVYQQDQQFRLAISYFEKARKAIGNAPAELLYQLGDAWLPLDTARAKKMYIESLAAAKLFGNPDYEFYSNAILSQVSFGSGDKQAGLFYFRAAEVNAGNSPSAINAAIIYGIKGYLASQDLDLDSTLYFYNKAFAIYDTVNRFTAVDYLNRMSSIYIAQGNFSQAGEVLDRAILISREISGNIELASSFVSASFLKILVGDVRAGLALNDSAMAIYGQSGNEFSLAWTLNTRGGLLITAGRYDDGVKSLLRSDSIYRRQGTEFYQAGTWSNIGVAYYNQDDYTNAVKYFKQSVAANKTGIVNEENLLTLSNLSEAYYRNKQVVEAEKLALAWLTVAKKKNVHRPGASFALTLAYIAYDRKQYKEVAAYLAYARKYSMMGSNQSLANVYVLSGKTAAQLGDSVNASTYFDQASSIARQFDIGSGRWISLYEAGVYYYSRGMYDSAASRLESAVELVEQAALNLLGGEEGKSAYSNDPRKVEMYSLLTSSLLKTNRQKEAFAYANRSGITGLQVLSGPAAVSGDENKKQALAGLNDLQVKKDALAKSAAAIRPDSVSSQKMLAIIEQTRIVEAEYSKYVEELVAKYPEIGLYFQRNANPDDFYNYKGELPDDLALLLYLPNGNDLMVFSLTNEDLSVAVVRMKPGINSAITAFKALAKNRAKAAGGKPLQVRSDVVDEEPVPSNISFRDVSAELYQLLIGSVEDKIRGKKKLCIIPNGNLSNLPFQCLGKMGDDHQFRYLLEDYSVFYTNQLDMFRNSRTQGNVVKPVISFAAFGVPDQTLHYNLDEVKTIGRIMGSDSTVYADGRATESAARRSLLNKKVVHFATHGTLNYNQYSQSYLKFLPDADTTGGRDGKLTIDEIKKLLITGCDLVTLSACETAVSNQLVKGWNISPANAFLQRKVRSVVASLWKVDDEATSLLMKDFYQNLGQGMEKVDALRLAQEKLSQDPRYTHPYFWGAFVLFGDWR
ncbi:MAG: CHAT domain-containing protein [Chitinophagaceae bacterium]|nr:MAG: CHAT domain-containing protein [Chitinophagaceae bacterium]